MTQASAHNTLVVDKREQRSWGVRGRCRFFGTSQGFRVVDVSTGQAYKGARLRRIVALTDDFVVLRDLAESDRPTSTFDWMFHGVGRWRSDQPTQAARDFKAYKRIDWRILQVTTLAWSGAWRSGDRGLRLFMAGAESTAVHTGDGPFPLHGPGEGHDPARRVPFVMARRQGSSTPTGGGRPASVFRVRTRPRPRLAASRGRATSTRSKRS